MLYFVRPLNENEDSKTLSNRQNPRISGDVGL